MPLWDTATTVNLQGNASCAKMYQKRYYVIVTDKQLQVSFYVNANGKEPCKRLAEISTCRRLPGNWYGSENRRVWMADRDAYLSSDS